MMPQKHVSEPLRDGNFPRSKYLPCLPMLSKTLDNEFKGFWNDSCAELSKTLPLIERTDQAENRKFTTSAKWNESLSNPVLTFHEASPITISANSLENISLTAVESDESLLIRAKTIALHQPPKLICQIYKRWINLSRDIYNSSIDIFSMDPKQRKISVRNEIVKSFAKEIEACTMPRTAVEEAVFEAYRAMKAAISTQADYNRRANWFNAKSENADKQKELDLRLPSELCKMRGCKDLTATISLDGRCINDGIIYQNSLRTELKKYVTGTGKTKTAIERSQAAEINAIIAKAKIDISKEDQKDQKICKLLWDRQRGKFSLFIPYYQQLETSDKIDEVVAIDPGIRTLAQFYSEKYSGAVGEEWLPRVMPLIKRSDALLERAADKSNKYYLRCRLKRRAASARLKARNIVKDMHHKTALFFTKNFQCILLPVMNTKQMVGEGVSSNLSRAIMTCSHYKFREIMIHKAQKHYVNLILCKEQWTSKTCTRCGFIKNDLGANKVYNCDSCKLTVDRDYNGARNIMLKHIKRGGATPHC